MPTFDMPLKELKEYTGSSPCPKNIDEYWDKALEEMRAVDADVSITESQFKCSFATCYDMYFTGVEGARIYAKLVKPKKIEGKVPAVVKFHGYAGNSGDWTGLLSFAAEGFVVAALDCRGQGGKSRDVGDRGIDTLRGHIIRGIDDGAERLLYRSIFLDTAQLAYLVMAMDEVDEKRVGCTGASQGGALTVACASLVPEMKLAAPIYPFLADYKRVWNMDLDTGAYAELTEFFRHFDPRHEREDEIFNSLGYVDIQNMAHRIKADVLMFTGLVDDVCPPSSQFAVYNKIVSAKSMKIYHDFAHENLPGASDIIHEFMLGLRD